VADVVGLYRAAGVTLRAPAAATWTTVRCFNPSHRDRHASARVSLETGGFRCFGCGSKGGAIAALELLGIERRRAVELAVDYGVFDAEPPAAPRRRARWQFLKPPTATTVKTTPAPPAANPQAATASVVDWDAVTAAAAAPVRERAWVYVDEHGRPVGRVRRLDLPDGSKRIFQERPDGDGWKPGLGGARLPLFQLPEVRRRARAGERVLVVEGEKCVDGLARVGMFGTTCAAGCGKWRAEHTRQLHGARVTVVADCDWPGRAHAVDITRALLAAGGRATMPLDLDPHRDDGYDVVDDLAELAATVRAVEPDITTRELRERLRRNLLDRVAALLPADERDLDRYLEHARFKTSQRSGYGDTLLRCDRCDAERPHRIRCGLAFCICGAPPALAP
jgi:hypothetical protein